MLTTIQDTAAGFQSRGVPVAGPMDLVSHRVPTRSSGTIADAAGWRITLLAPNWSSTMSRLVRSRRGVRALAGGRIVRGMRRSVGLAGSRLGSVRVAGGARVRIFGVRRIAVPPELGSRSTHLVSAMVGIAWRALRAGDRLPLGHTT